VPILAILKLSSDSALVASASCSSDKNVLSFTFIQYVCNNIQFCFRDLFLVLNPFCGTIHQSTLIAFINCFSCTVEAAKTVNILSIGWVSFEGFKNVKVS
jgi:hypothetical protein